MIRNTRRAMAPFCLSAIALMLMACGNNSGGGSSKSASAQEEVESLSASFRAQLTPLNTNVVQNVIGHSIWSVKDGDYRIQINMTNTPENLEHFQAVHEGSKCPDQSSDRNGDGIIDITELNAVSGKIIMTLDSNPTSSSEEDFVMSRSNEFGNYTYWAEVGVRELGFNPAQKTIVVYGIDSNFSLPRSVSEVNANKHRYIPISCGVIKSVNAQKVY